MEESLPRIESKQKVTGSLRYLEDLKIPGMLHAKTLRSPLPHAKIVSIDTSVVERLPGVVAILTRADLIGSTHYRSHYGPVLKDQSIVALDKVRYVGDVVAAVAATQPDIAEEALDHLHVDYQELPAVYDPEEALEQKAPVLHDTIQMPKDGPPDLKKIHRKEKSNLAHHVHVEKGNLETGLAESDHVFEQIFSCPSTQHAAMESFVSVARFEGSGRLTIWSTTQHPFLIREEMASLFQLPLSRVRVIALNVGGGYGGKGYIKMEPVVAALAYKTKLPVGIRLTREESFQTIAKHAAKIYIKTGVKKNGEIVARQCRIFMNTGAYAEIGPRVIKKCAYSSLGPYEIPNVKIDAHLVYTNTVPAGAFRGFGLPQAAWGYESSIDVIAHNLKRDPLELRLQNLLDEGGEFVTGEHIHSFGMKNCLTKVAEAIEWDKREPANGSKVRGKGLACGIQGTMTPSISSATIRLNEDGSATVYVGTVDMGQGSDTVLSQIASKELSIPIDHIELVRSDTDTSLYDLKTAASRSTFHMGRAVQKASQDIREQLSCLAAPIFQINPENFVFENQTLRPKGAQLSEALSYQALLIQHFEIKGINLMGQGRVKTSNINKKGEPEFSVFWNAGAGAAEVEVDRETGRVRIIRYVTAADIGKALNPMSCHQQLRGGAISGIGQALLEELVYQEGLLINPNLLDYNLPCFPDMPQDIQTIIVEHPNPQGPYGAKGVGEIAALTPPPAIVNAIEDAVNVRIQQLPVTSEKILTTLLQKNKENKK